MISETDVLDNLRILDSLYQTAGNDKERLFYSKLAILELCGWIEESMDIIISNCASRKIQRQDLQEFIQDKILDKNSGFEYYKNFRYMLSQVVGLIGIETLEKSVDQRKFQVLCSTLAMLKNPRNDLAHTHIAGATTTISAPSWTIGQLPNVYEGLKEIDDKLAIIGF